MTAIDAPRNEIGIRHDNEPADQVRVRTPATVIVPTRNEEGNVRELLRRLVPVLPAGSEVIFVDDSDDDTVAVIEEAAADRALPVRVHHREPGQRGDGLGGAVAAGLAKATCDWCVVMDADLQHPPELVPVLVAEGQATESQLVVASRYGGAGDADTFSAGRAALSTWATRLTKAFFPRRLAAVHDPMSGFFAVRRDAVDVTSLRPNGFKILLEIAVRCGPLRTIEVPFHFGRRFAGESKANLAECARLVSSLSRLWFAARSTRPAGRMLGFGLVGLSGLLVNTVALWFVAQVVGLHYAPGVVLATVASTVWNWALLERLVYPSGARRARMARLGAFAGLNVLALFLRVPLIALLVESLAVNYLVANAATIVLIFALRFVLSDSVIFRGTTTAATAPEAPSTAAPVADTTVAAAAAPVAAPVAAPAAVVPTPVAATVAPTLDEVAPEEPAVVATATNAPGNDGYLPHRYVVPGVATIGSEVPLPELQWFLTPFRTRGPFDIEIRVGRIGHLHGHVQFVAEDASRRYEEHLGAFGANFHIEMGDRIRITVGPLLEHSPHVLYTNVVEALLRFLAVTHKRVLLHSACVRLGNTGIMLSARTDTGKTGTILRLIREEGATFLSDDMTIISPKGRAHCFPKPLTISHHTLLAVDSHGLSKREWRWLRLQSRLHSKEGRQFGMRLAAMNLPIMTVNAMTQAVVPPPKYDVDRLVPCDVARRVDVSDLFIIERGLNEIADVSTGDALPELIDNTDDAYGFPPFATLAPTLVVGGMDYAQLRRREEELLAKALRHIRVRRVVRDDFGWPAAIRSLVAEDSIRAADGEGAGRRARRGLRRGKVHAPVAAS
ncbi:glycosyltransferase [uncultured Phycicoccus sp.]|uniref:glycosyltransferase n=1 Tax=uncultured Phycicoccus sp. TaxID=661422 RepID=UPI0026094D12|nr:glycosyltransferase [uncultured Phycicoccus sp.]